MPRPSPVSNLTAAALSILSLFLCAGPAEAGKSIAQRVSQLEKQVEAANRQIAALQVQMASLAPLTLQVDCGNG